MNTPLLVANWKATKTTSETEEFITKLKPSLSGGVSNLVICPSFVSIPTVKELVGGTGIKIGAQDVSKFSKGAFTGEVTSEMLEGLVEFCIVGHSERRKNFGENDDDVIDKVDKVLARKITPILCVSNLVQLDTYLEHGKNIIDQADKIIFVYEPPGAISGGGDYKPEDPESANTNAGRISEKIGKKITTLYGGSINPENAERFFSQGNIDGGLIGQASTHPDTFTKLIEIATN